MKQRIRWIGCICFVFISFLFLFSGCGGGGSEVSSGEDTRSAVILGRIIVPDGADPNFHTRMRSDMFHPEYDDNIPLINASISVSGIPKSVFTDSDGYFILTDVPTNKDLVITAIKGNIKLLKQLKALQPGEEKIVLVNYQTTAASLVYDQIVKQGGSPDIEMLEKMTNCDSSPVFDVADRLKALLKESILSHLTGNITEHANISEKLAQIEDGLPPELISFSFSPSTIDANSTVKISAILNEETWLTSGYLYLRDYSNQERSIIILKDEFIYKFIYEGKLSGTWKIETDLKILGYERPGEYFICGFEVCDVFGNCIVYSSHPDSIQSVFENRIRYPSATVYPAYLRWDYAEYEILPTLSVKNANPDVEPPTFEGLSMEPVILSSSKDEVTINIVSYDKSSGVKDVDIELELFEEYYHTFSFSSDIVSHNANTGQYEAEFTIAARNFYYSGELILSEINITDKNDNMLSLKRNDPNADPDFWKSLPTLTIEDSAIEHEPEEEEGPEFISVKFFPNPANAGDEVTAVVQLSNPNMIDYIDIEIENSSGDSYMGFYLYDNDIHFDEESGSWIGEKKRSLSSFVESGDWAVYSLSSSDMEGNYTYISRYSHEIDQLSVLSSILTINPNPKEDIIPPEITSMVFSPRKVNQGDELILTLEIKDDSSGPVKVEIDVMKEDAEFYYGYHTCPKKYFSLISYDVRKGETMEGTWEIIAKTTVPHNTETGNWKVRYIYVYDLSGKRKSYPIGDSPDFILKEETKFIIEE